MQLSTGSSWDVLQWKGWARPEPRRGCAQACPGCSGFVHAWNGPEAPSACTPRRGARGRAGSAAGVFYSADCMSLCLLVACFRPAGYAPQMRKRSLHKCPLQGFSGLEASHVFGSLKRLGCTCFARVRNWCLSPQVQDADCHTHGCAMFLPIPACPFGASLLTVWLILQDTPPPGRGKHQGDTSGSVQADTKGVVSASKSPVLGSRPEAAHSAGGAPAPRRPIPCRPRRRQSRPSLPPWRTTSQQCGGGQRRGFRSRRVPRRCSCERFVRLGQVRCGFLGGFLATAHYLGSHTQNSISRCMVVACRFAACRACRCACRSANPAGLMLAQVPLGYAACSAAKLRERQRRGKRVQGLGVA